MALLGHLIARSLRLRKQFTLPQASARTYQRQVLRQLLDRGQYTAFGKHYEFGRILSQEVDFITAFRETVPAHTYNEMFSGWWHRLLQGEENVTWPGKIKYFALSSGTSESASKHIPVTRDMIKVIKKAGFKQLYSMTAFEVPPKTFQKGILMLGGTTTLSKKEDYYEGDMSGISARNIPKLVSSFLYKPGQKISKTKEWKDRINMIVERAPGWDVGTICGVPAWVQIVLEEIIRKHDVKNIHEIWPNLEVYIHGGVSFEPYREAFKRLLDRPITYIETYMASEGTFGFQAKPGAKGIRLMQNNGIFYEFVPFNEENFDEDGNPRKEIRTVLLHEVNNKTEYAVMLSTCSGAWRYIIGDVVRFTDATAGEIIITGRTKQFLSLCGEHLSVDNMNKAVDVVQKKHGIQVREFMVAGFPHEGMFAHRWYVGCDDDCANAAEIRATLDATLRELNDDYAVERDSALKNIYVDVLPNKAFYDFLKQKGKEGAMNKFPRVMKGKQLDEWQQYLEANKIVALSRI